MVLKNLEATGCLRLYFGIYTENYRSKDSGSASGMKKRHPSAFFFKKQKMQQTARTGGKRPDY
jgi:hypothetical protein